MQKKTSDKIQQNSIYDKTLNKMVREGQYTIKPTYDKTIANIISVVKS